MSNDILKNAQKRMRSERANEQSRARRLEAYKSTIEDLNRRQHLAQSPLSNESFLELQELKEAVESEMSKEFSADEQSYLSRGAEA